MRAAVVVLVWAAWLTVLALVLWIWTDDPLAPGLLAAAAGGAWLLGGALALRPGPGRSVRRVPDVSLPTPLLALGIASLLNGALLGRWLVLVGAGVTALGLATLTHELRSERRRAR